MKHYLAMLAGVVSVTAVMFAPAWAIDVQPGGKGGASVTVGEATTDDGDEIIDRCECDGGPLEVIVVRVARGTDPVRIDRIVGASARTSDGVQVGVVIKADNNTGDNAIVIIVRVDDDALPMDRIAVRRTAFYYDEGVIVIDTSMADLLSSVQAAANAGA
ncbi:MAG: hypothetical protein ACTSWI_02350 [Alphaproteobacteria bacterium]